MRAARGRSAAGAALAAAALGLAGCATPGARPDALPAVRDERAVSAQAAQTPLVAGRSTKADALAAFGPAASFRFDSGYEVWAWRWGAAREDAPGGEMVVLFDSRGVVMKTRVKPPP